MQHAGYSDHATESGSNESATEVAMNFLQAWTSGDRETARALCHPELRFQGPMETRSSADQHVSALSALGSNVAGLNNVRAIAQGTDVVLFYDLMLTTPARTVAIAELNVVRGGKLAEIRAYFDTHPLRGDTPGARRLGEVSR